MRDGSMSGVFFEGEKGEEASPASGQDDRFPQSLPMNELREVASRLLRIATDLEDRVLMQSTAAPQELGEFLTLRDIEREEPLLANFAERVYDCRRRRNRYIDDDLLGEPAWDMLLDLFINHARKQRVPTTSLCIASQAPTTTALRWISILEQRKLIRRVSSKRDQRVHYVELEEKGYRAVTSLLRDMIGK